MIIETFICDRCGHDTKYVTPLVSKPIGLDRELCATCIESLKAFLSGKPDPHMQTVLRFETKELEEVYRKGAEALEMWATGATADQLAQEIRDMLSRAKREVETRPKTILGVAV